jgi:penicillin-binding protein 1A
LKSGKESFLFNKIIHDKNPLIKNTLIKALIILIITAVFSIVLGFTLSGLNNMNNIETLLETKRPALPSILLDRHGQVITKYYSDEKRDMISLDEIPPYLVKGLIAWEDESFYRHNGFNILAILRAGVGNIFGRQISGASTLTQQLARTLFLNKEFSLIRKVKELFVSIQLEKKYTKNEILTLYLNHIPLGYGTNGVQSASKFYFNKDVSDLTYAEAASLITVISNPTYYSIISFPQHHKQKQQEVLKRMVKTGIISKVDADNSLNEFWLKYQSTSLSSRGAFFNREDQAPFFSDYVLNEIQDKLPNVNIFKDGLTIYSTLDLKANVLADNMMKEVLDRQQKIFEQQSLNSYNVIQTKYIDEIYFLQQMFDLAPVRVTGNRYLYRSMMAYGKDINPGLNLTAQIFGLPSVDTVTQIMFDKDLSSKNLLSQVQGAFIAVENSTGQIVTMVGGKNFDPNNRFNYAMQSRRQPGSSFKPLAYSAALDSGMFTAASVLIDKPYVFTFGSDDPDDWYKPENYGGAYYGKVTLRRAIRRSLNIPACQVFYAIGKNNNYKVPIDRAAALLGIKSQQEINARLKPEVSTVLGTGSVSPVEMATAFATFANQGKRRIPNGILYVEDRDGKIIYEPWKELQKYYKENDSKLQVISPQNAFIITNILRDTVHSPDGFLYYTKQRIINEGKEFPPVELAGKTGTTQNWSDAWEVGFSPEITVASWVGFNKYGLSLGNEQAGVNVLGPTFLEYMRQYHIGKGTQVFKNPGGLYQVQVCKESGLLPSKYCKPESLYYEYFLPGTVPQQVCNVCENANNLEEQSIDSMLEEYEKKGNADFKLQDDFKLNVDKSIIDKYGTKDDINIDEKLDKVDLYKNTNGKFLDDISADRINDKSGKSKEPDDKQNGTEKKSENVKNDPSGDKQ